MDFAAAAAGRTGRRSSDKPRKILWKNEELGLAIECWSHSNVKTSVDFKMKTIDGVDTETICNEFASPV